MLQRILSQVDARCVCNSCQDHEETCSLSLEGLSDEEYVLLSMDGPGSPASQLATRCDFLFFRCVQSDDSYWGCPVELTAGLSKSSTTIIKQLQAGALLIDSLVPADLDIQFVPIVACPFRKHRRNEYRKRENAVSFRSGSYLVHAVNCSSRMVDALARQ